LSEKNTDDITPARVWYATDFSTGERVQYCDSTGKLTREQVKSYLDRAREEVLESDNLRGKSGRADGGSDGCGPCCNKQDS